MGEQAGLETLTGLDPYVREWLLSELPEDVLRSRWLNVAVLRYHREPATRETLDKIAADVRRHGPERLDDLATASAPDGSRWEFGGDVAAAFDDMLERSIPDYPRMRQLTTAAASWLLERFPHGCPSVVDLGVSRGAGLVPLIDRHGDRAAYAGFDLSDAMLEQARRELADPIARNLARVERHDLRDGFPHVAARPVVVLSILTLQFVPIEYRQTLLQETCEQLEPGGGLILVEKVLGRGAAADRLLVDLYYGMKRAAGYTDLAVERKRLALEGVLVPLTADFNVEMLRAAGFDVIETIWAALNFRGWVAIKR